MTTLSCWVERKVKIHYTPAVNSNLNSVGINQWANTVGHFWGEPPLFFMDLSRKAAAPGTYCFRGWQIAGLKCYTQDRKKVPLQAKHGCQQSNHGSSISPTTPPQNPPPSLHCQQEISWEMHMLSFTVWKNERFTKGSAAHNRVITICTQNLHNDLFHEDNASLWQPSNLGQTDP